MTKKTRNTSNDEIIIQLAEKIIDFVKQHHFIKKKRNLMRHHCLSCHNYEVEIFFSRKMFLINLFPTFAS